jgi:hypothetical protein
MGMGNKMITMGWLCYKEILGRHGRALCIAPGRYRLGVYLRDNVNDLSITKLNDFYLRISKFAVNEPR